MLSKVEDIYGMAQRMYDAAGREYDLAVEKVVEQLTNRAALQPVAFRIAAEQLIGVEQRRTRAAILGGGEGGYIDIVSPPSVAPTLKDVTSIPGEMSPAAKKASAEAHRAFTKRLTGLYLTPYRFGGKDIILGKATPEELRPIAAHFLGQGATMVRHGRWLERVISGAKNGQPIHRSITLKQLERWKDETDQLPV